MTFAYIALFSWPVVAVIAFRRLNVPVALMITLIPGYLLLPTQVNVDLPGLPPMNKNTIPALSALVLAVLIYKTPKTTAGKLKAQFSGLDFSQSRLLPKSWLARLCLILLPTGGLLTVFSNGDPLRYGPTLLPGLRLYDGLSVFLGLVMMIVPFVLAHKFIAHPNMQRSLLKIMVMAALGYSLLALYEIRMSPQLNLMVYGFFPHSFLQHVRGDGYRPLVFLSHGLVLAIFFSMVILAAVGLARVDNQNKRVFYVAAGLWLLLTLVLSRSLGALVIVLALLPIAILIRPWTQLMVSMLIAIMVITYPALRSADLIPVDRIMSYAQQVDPQRAQSLDVRLQNENALLAKALERPYLGWGGYGRSRIVTQSGVDVSRTDGTWVIVLGVGGWLRYLTQFGLACLPIILLFFARKRFNIGMETSILTLILSANLIDLIPNSSQSPLTWIIAGSLWGRLSLGQISEQDSTDSDVLASPRELEEHPPYARPHRKHEVAKRPKSTVRRHSPSYARGHKPKHHKT